MAGSRGFFGTKTSDKFCVGGARVSGFDIEVGKCKFEVARFGAVEFWVGEKESIGIWLASVVEGGETRSAVGMFAKKVYSSLPSLSQRAHPAPRSACRALLSANGTTEARSSQVSSLSNARGDQRAEGKYFFFIFRRHLYSASRTAGYGE